MPPEALSLALAASIYPPALAAVIALGRGVEVRLRVTLFVVAAYLTAFAVSAAMLFLFAELEVNRTQLVRPTAALYLIGGCLLLFAATRLRRKRQRPPAPHDGPSRTDRYLRRRSLALALGVILYVVPSPIVVGAVKVIADTNVSTGQQVAYLAQMVLIMLWLIELPMLMLLVRPAPSLRALERINAWFAARGRALLALLSAALGAYLVVVGAIELAS
jgi:hypothetical protein